MFSLKSNLLFSALLDAKNYAKKINLRVHHLPHSEASPRELQQMRSELRAAREHARLMNVINRNRVF